MNNAQFRKLVLDTPARQAGVEDSGSSVAARKDGATTSLGSRTRASIPMTPRAVSVDFARQVADSRKESKPTRKFRSAAAPLGTRLPSGYVDRAKLRAEHDEGGDDKEGRIKALEEMLKLQQIDQATFENLRDEIVGGDVSTTHLVKGLDRKLLERVRRGEDVLSTSDDAPPDEDLDDELEQFEQKEVVAVTREKTAKKGVMAPPSLVPGQKRTRDQILAEMKAARKAAQEAAQPSLGSNFKRITEKNRPRLEIDDKGREVLITYDEDGNEKRKVRKIQPPEKVELPMPDEKAEKLGMEVPTPVKPPEDDDDDDDDIFADAGDDYDPLAGLDESGDEAEEKAEPTADAPKTSDGSMPPPPKQPSGPRNYFGTKVEEESPNPKRQADAAIMAALKKAASLNPIATEPVDAAAAERAARHKKMLENFDRDAADMDMGFGSSRVEDEEDMEDNPVKLAEWKGIGQNDDDDDKKGRGGKARKRAPKKRKGDANNLADVMKVLERRKQG